MHITNAMLANIFADAAIFCGKEDVLHAMIHRGLRAGGIGHDRIAREQTLSGNRVDIVLYDKSVKGRFAETTEPPLAVIEIKGGAYNTRNALRDEIDANGYCTDMDKLAAAARKGIESWFLCVDMPELGRAVSSGKLGLISRQCQDRGLSFAYFSQDEPHFYVVRPGKEVHQMPVVKGAKPGSNTTPCFLLNNDDPGLASLARECLMVSGHEANITARLYDTLRSAGLGSAQVSLETYFSFASRAGSRMQLRPDLVVFDAQFDGRFNLYRNGDVRQSNDQHKLAHIDTIFEIKGGAAMSRKSDKAIMKDCLSDREKLRLWREAASDARQGTKVKTTFLCVNGRPTGLPAGAVEHLADASQSQGNGFIYIDRGRLVAVPA